MTYLASSVLGFIIFVQRATWHAHRHIHGDAGLQFTSAYFTCHWQVGKDAPLHRATKSYICTGRPDSLDGEEQLLLDYVLFAQQRLEYW